MKLILGISALLAFCLSSGCATIGPGQVGVLWTALSGTEPKIYHEGLHSVTAWNEMLIYDLRYMSRDELLNVIASNGLSIQLDASVRYRLLADEVFALHEEIGPDYYKRILEPVLRSEARRVLGNYTPEEIYSTKRDLIEREIREGAKAKITGKHVELEAVLIRNIELPGAIRAAIDEKLAAEQQVEKMKYVLEVARASAEQKHVEAQAIADYNRLVASSLSASIIEFERVQQLTALSASKNAKTVVLGDSHGANLLVGTTTAGEAR